MAALAAAGALDALMLLYDPKSARVCPDACVDTGLVPGVGALPGLRARVPNTAVAFEQPKTVLHCKACGCRLGNLKINQRRNPMSSSRIMLAATAAAFALVATGASVHADG